MLDRMGEILSQGCHPLSVFLAMVLNLQPGRHRYIFELLAAAFNPCLGGGRGPSVQHHFGSRDRST